MDAVPLLTSTALRSLRRRIDRGRWEALFERWLEGRAPRPRRPMRHGTASCYRAGCRRPACRAAHAAAVRAYRQRTGRDGYRRREED